MNNQNRSNTGNNNMVMPPLPTGSPSGPQYAPYKMDPSTMQQFGSQPGQMMPGAMPPPAQGCLPGECPVPYDVNTGLPAPTTLPGMRTGTGAGSVAPLPGAGMGMGAAPLPGSFASGEQPPITTMNPMYTPGYLRTQIGKMVRVEFLIGTSGLSDRIGTLVGVGTSYILLREVQSDDILLCDIYSIKFVTFYM